MRRSTSRRRQTLSPARSRRSRAALTSIASRRSRRRCGVLPQLDFLRLLLNCLLVRCRWRACSSSSASARSRLRPAAACIGRTSCSASSSPSPSLVRHFPRRSFDPCTSLTRRFALRRRVQAGCAAARPIRSASSGVTLCWLAASIRARVEWSTF